MALFSTYMKPGVYTTVVYVDGGVTLFGSARIPVIIGEGQEVQTLPSMEVHRGSSNVADEQMALENLSSQILPGATNRSYKTTYNPIVTGNGTGTVTNAVTAIKAFNLDAQGNLIPLTVTVVNGSTGAFQIAEILIFGQDQLQVSYSFKRMDLLVSNEDLTYQVPSFATFPAQTGLLFSLSLPGELGNNVSLGFTLAAVNSGVTDALAVTGAGTSVLSIELMKPNGSVRTLNDILTLVSAGIPTYSAGLLTAIPTQGASLTTPGIAVATHPFSGGGGQNTNTTFQTKNAPVVDGSNGGVVVNTPAYMKVTVNGVAVPVVSLDGVHGIFKLASGVNYGSRLLVTYYTNTFQNTYDEIPATNVSAVLSAGYAPGRSDFVNGTDFILQNDKIYWGAASVTAQGQATPGFTPFDASVVTTTLMDEKMSLVQALGSVDGLNTVFSLQDAPTDGSGKSVVTNDPQYLQVFVGSTPVEAYAAGPLRVIRLDGTNQTFTLYNPPPAGQAVWASYWRNTLNQNNFVLTVLVPGPCGQGSYSISDQSGNIVPAFTIGQSRVADANFNLSGIVWPFAESDLRGVPGSTPTETITVTFQDDGLSHAITPAVQATDVQAQAGLIFRATTTGTGPNYTGTSGPSVQMVNIPGPCSDAAAITVAGDVVTINISREDPLNPGTPNLTNPTRSLGDIVSLVTNGNFATPTLGQLLCSLATPTTDATLLCASGPVSYFTGGSTQVTRPYSNRFKVSSSRSAADSKADGKGITGGATTDTTAPAFGQDTVGAIGFLGQTFEDVNTGVKFTLVDPAQGLSYGFTTLPTIYSFTAGDTLVFIANSTVGSHITSNKPVVGISGLNTKVTTTYGMNPGDTVLIQNFNNSGNEPAVGEFYYLMVQTTKVSANFLQTSFSSLSDIEAAYGPSNNPINRVSLAAKLLFQNGGTSVMIRQVPKQVGLETASDQDYMAAITDFTMPLRGSDRKVDVIIPMTTSATVIQFLAKQLTVQASPRQCGEAYAYLGLPLTITADAARAMVTALNSERCTLIWPGGALLSLLVNNQSVQFSVDGCFLAAAMAGLALASGNDVATSLTLGQLVGFDRLIANTPSPVMDLLSGDGITVLTEVPGALEIRDYLTTCTDSVLQSQPTSTCAIDATRQLMRKTLKPFVARKSLEGIVTDITIVSNSALKSLVGSILTSYTNFQASMDPNNPMTVNVSVSVKPMFSIMWVNLTFNVTAQG